MTIEQLQVPPHHDLEHGEPISAGRKVLVVLQAFGALEGSVSLTELARHTGLPKSTTHRMVGFLRSEGMVVMVDGKFSLTPVVTELSSAVPTGVGDDLREVLLPRLVELYEATHEAVYLMVRLGNVMKVLDRVHGRRSAGLTSQFRGPIPLHCTASGKIALVGEDLTGPPARLTAHTPATITTVDRLRTELASVRKYGVAFNRGEWRSGVTAVAAPVWGPRGVLVGALCVAGSIGSLMPDAVAWRVRQSAHLASTELRAADATALTRLTG